VKPKTLHMIGNAHIDPVWLWRWQEGFQEVKATFRSALDRLQEYDDFLFVASSAAFYAWVEKNDPPMFAEIRQRVAEGRWGLAGGWWIEPDCNVPGGESFVRQGLYGQRYFQEKFGLTARVGYNVDSFGHHAMLPQILKKSGLDFYVFMRPGPHEKDLPGHLFWWEADDGSRVLAFRILEPYCTWEWELEPHVRRCAKALAECPLDELMCFYGVGNHGGGPTKENIETIRRLQAEGELPTLILSTPERFFESVSRGQAVTDPPLAWGACRARPKPPLEAGVGSRLGQAWGACVPVVHDELQHHASGCYAAHSGVKRWNRRAEHLLLTAEKWAAIASWTTGQPYPTDLAQAWQDMLFNQFHDVLAGTSVEAAYEDAQHLYGEALAIAGRALNAATQSLAWNVHIEPEDTMQPVVVFNPHAWPSRANVELEVSGLQGHGGLVDEAGHPVPVQWVQPQATTGWHQRISFVADLPPLGYRTYRLVHQAPPVQVSPPLQATDLTMENDLFCLEIAPETGTIESLYDKRHRQEVFLGEAARPVVIDDPSDTWSHGVYRFDREIGAFTAHSIRLVEHGPVRSTIRVVSKYGASQLVQDFTLYAELPRIDVRVTVDWHERFKMLKMRFPLRIDAPRALYEIPYGHLERPVNGEEEPGQGWVDVSGKACDTGAPYGLALLNDGKYSLDVNGPVIGLTVLRSPIYAHHVPAVPDAGLDYAFVDQGLQRFTYALLPHGGGCDVASAVKRAAELNQPPIALLETAHPAGTLPQVGSYLSVDQDNVVVSVIKQAEDGDGWIVRGYETKRQATQATIRLLHQQRVIEAHFGPCEIKTFRIPQDGTRPVVETDLLEQIRPIADSL